ncbi:site-specific recombinase XerD [Streptosporangium becharense]|uniref:Site-specific recombinase XerD n=1 Tax=Streptosporangium becharense TaxID=1816182 RepID=A0A7W9MEL2_9ACTN|nr:tyrosine-type recombinase/integrase [Streptosporangium becharense]MBB2910891.1 site-specific recombinase XerD [Streptosporangium becharense]MBB5817586.1 site-specific recombinase XerD [Streptosporangium becharense]
MPPAPGPAVEPARDPYRVYLDSLSSAESRRTMRGCLDRLAVLISGDETASGAGQPWHLLRYEHTVRIRALMTERGWSPSYINKHLVALRRVLREAWRLGQMTAEEYQRAADLPTVEHTRLPAGQHVPAEVVGAALAACERDDSPAGVRDAALLATLYSTGCRRAEIAALTLADYDPGSRSLRVRGKRDKERMVYLTAEAAGRMERWLAVRGRPAGALFCPVNRFGRLRVRNGGPAPMTGQAVADILTRRLAEAGAMPRTPHDFRRTFIGELLDAGVDLATAQALVGHSSPATTARYDRRPERRRREAVDRITLPPPRPL